MFRVFWAPFWGLSKGLYTRARFKGFCKGLEQLPVLLEGFPFKGIRL